MVGLFAFWRLEKQERLPNRNVNFLQKKIIVVCRTHLPHRRIIE
jgi:hypothetical protein